MFEAFETLLKAMAELSGAVAAGLEPQGWQRRDRGGAALFAHFTRPLADGLLATVTVALMGMSSETWPAPLRLRFGAGYEPATALMPVVTLRWHFALVDEAAPDDGDGPLAITGPEGIAPAAQRIVALATQHAAAFAERFSSVADLDAALAGTEGSAPTHGEVQDRAVLLAASGQHDTAREVLNGYTPSGLSESEELAYRRFARQLGRWLDAGGPAIPPLEESLREMPELRMPQRPDKAQSRQKSRATREALLAVRDKAAGKTRAELGEMLAAEFAARDLDMPTSFEMAVHVDMLEAGQRPFGKARQTWRALRLTGKTLGDTVGAVRGRQEPNPDWMAPPEYASYPLRAAGGRFVDIEVTANAAAVLRRACTEASQHIGPQVFVDLWLSEANPAGSGAVTVHLGEHVIGSVAPSDAAEVAGDMRRAAAREENVRVRGRLYAAGGGGVPSVEIGLPDRERDDEI